MPDDAVDDPHVAWEICTALLAAGVLPEDEVAGAERHVVGCLRCRRDLRELGEVSAALRDVDSTEEPTPELVDRVVQAVGRARRREQLAGRSRWAVAAAASVVALLATGSLLPGLLDAPREQVTLVAADDDVSVRGALVEHTWGTELEMVVDGLPAGRTYTVEFRDDQGRRFPAGAFLGADRPVVCDMNAAVLRADATQVQVLDQAGVAVVTGEL